MPRYDYAGYGGAGDRPTAYTDGFVQYDFVAPSPRQAANGSRPGIVTSLEFVVAGRGGTRQFAASLENVTRNDASASSWVGIGADSSAGSGAETFLIGGTGFYPGHVLRTRVNADGSFWYNRNSGGPGSVQTPGGNVGGSLAGGINFMEVPAAPTMTSYVSSADGRSAVVRFASGDNGGGDIRGWRLQRSTNPGFTANIVTIDAPLNGVAGISGLTPGQAYFFRAAGRNWVADWDGTTGPWAQAVGGTQNTPATPEDGKRWDGKAWVSVSGKRWNGDEWVSIKGRRWNGKAWVDL